MSILSDLLRQGLIEPVEPDEATTAMWLDDAGRHLEAAQTIADLDPSGAYVLAYVVLIAPTSTSARPASFRPEIEVEGNTTKVLVEQMRAVDINRLGGLAGHLTSEEQWGVDQAILTVLGLN